MKKTLLTTVMLFAVALLATTAQAQTLVAKWNKNTFTASTTRGLAYNPATGHLLSVAGGAPGSIRIINSANGITNTTPTMTYPTNGAGTYWVGGIAAASDGVIYGCNYGTTTLNVYKWASESASPTILYTGAFVGAGSVGANLAVYGTGNSAVLVLSSTTTGGVLVYHNGSAWVAKSIPVVTQTLTSGVTFIDYGVAGPGLYRVMAKTGQTTGQIYTLDPTQTPPTTATNAQSGKFGFALNGIHEVAYDPLTGLIAAATRVQSTTFYGTNMLFNSGVVYGNGTLASPAELNRVNFTGPAGDAGSPGGVVWGDGTCFMMNPANRLYAYDVSAYKITDITGSTTNNVGESATFSVVAGGSGTLTYTWKKAGVALSAGSKYSGLDTPSLTVNDLLRSDAASYTCTVGGAGTSTWTSTNSVLTVNGATTSTALALSSGSTPSAYSDALTFTATVTGSTPTGTVQFKSGDSNLGAPVALTDGVAEYTTTALPAGSLSLTAVYSGDDYNNASTSSAVTQEVTAKSLVPSVTINNKGYDGTTAASIATRSLAGIVGTDDVTLGTSGVAVFDNAIRGTGKNVTVTGLALSGSTAGNYLLTTDTLTTTADIGVGTLNITASNLSKTYGETLSVAGTEFVATGLALGDSISFVTLTSDGTGAASVAGTHSIVPSDVVGSFNPADYSINYVNGTLTVTPAALSITADNASKIYGQTTTFAGTEFTSSALQNSETLGTVTLTSDGAAATGSAGAHSIVPSAATGGTFDPANYNITYLNGTLTVTPTPVTPAVTIFNKQYDGTNTAVIATRSLTGVLNDDDVSLGTTGDAFFADALIATGKTVTVTNLSLSGTTAVNYVLSATEVTATADIIQKTLTLTGLIASKVYDGNTAIVPSGTVALSGIAPGEEADVTLTGAGTATWAFADANAGAAKTVTATGLGLEGAKKDNYLLDSTVAGSIAKAAATVTLGDLSAIYDGSAKNASVVTDPLDLTVSVTYEGSATIPTTAGD